MSPQNRNRLQALFFTAPVIFTISYHSKFTNIQPSSLLIWIQTRSALPIWAILVAILIFVLMLYRILKPSLKVRFWNWIFSKILTYINQFKSFPLQCISYLILGYLAGNIVFSIIIKLFLLEKAS
ncbi:hypothetical protein DOM22_18830 [Bdellovibrio sp. ZAP7]|nr:hypothetical protein DOM22_18830 [Bdellovibrio sp. ZAP7]